MEWAKCEVCGQEADQVFILEFRTQHCSPTSIHSTIICDLCLEKRNVNPDDLVMAIMPRR